MISSGRVFPLLTHQRHGANQRPPGVFDLGVIGSQATRTINIELCTDQFNLKLMPARTVCIVKSFN